jgi:hypothetical protein
MSFKRFSQSLLGEELCEIQERLLLAKSRERFIIYPGMSVRPTDLIQDLPDIEPNIVHFSGYHRDALYLEDQCGKLF